MRDISRNIVFCIVVGFVLSISTFALGEYVSVVKNSTAAVVSGSTGTNTFYAFYGGYRTAGTLYVTAQYYEAGIYKDVPGGLALDSNNVTGQSSVRMPPYKIYRVMLYGSSGRGSGWIQGQD